MASSRAPLPIARIYPADGSFSQHVIESNPTRYRPPFAPPPSSVAPPNHRFLKYTQMPCLELTFDNPPRHSQGFLFGSSKTHCDVILDEQLGLHAVHFLIGYNNDYEDGMYRLAVRDIGTSNGTLVTYGTRGTDFRRDFQWTISGCNFVDESEIVITVGPGKEYIVVPMLYDIRDMAYVDAVEAHTDGLPRFFPRIEVSASFTALPETITEEQLMDSPSGRTRKIWNPSTAKAYAQKSLNTRPKASWIAHVRRFASLNHENILKVMKFEPAVACVDFQWKPLGHLAYQHSVALLTFGECLMLFQQSLSALAFLHSQQPFMAHGNIRPENILISSRAPNFDPSGLTIQLSDFGILETDRLPCSSGALRYKAPEILVSGEYTDILMPDFPPTALPTADMWAIGMVMLQVGYNKALVRLTAQGMITYCLQLHQLIRRWKDDELVVLLRQCLDYRPAARSSAQCVLDGLNRCLDDGSLRPMGPPFHACTRARVDPNHGDADCYRVDLCDDIYGMMVADERIFHHGQMRVHDVLRQREREAEHRRRLDMEMDDSNSELHRRMTTYMNREESDSDSSSDESDEEIFVGHEAQQGVGLHNGIAMSNDGSGSGNGGEGGSGSGNGGAGQGSAQVTRPPLVRSQPGTRGSSAPSSSCSDRGQSRRKMSTIWEDEDEEGEVNNSTESVVGDDAGEGSSNDGVGAGAAAVEEIEGGVEKEIEGGVEKEEEEEKEDGDNQGQDCEVIG